MGWLARVSLLVEVIPACLTTFNSNLVEDSGIVATFGKETFSDFSLSSGSLIHPTLTSAPAPSSGPVALGSGWAGAEDMCM